MNLVMTIGQHQFRGKMKIDEKLIKKICKTWKDSQYGHIKIVQEKKQELSDLLEKLYIQIYGEIND